MAQTAFSADPPITAVAFAPDGKSIVAGSQAGVVVRAWPELQTVRELPTDLVQVHDLAFSPEGRRLAVAGGDPAQSGAVEIFTWPDGKLQHRLELHEDVAYDVAWSDDGGRVFSAGLDRAAIEYDAGSGRVVRRFRGHSKGVTAVLALSAGNEEPSLLVTAGRDNSLRVWNAADGDQMRSLNNHTRPVRALAVRPDPKGEAVRPMIASISADRTVRFWQPTIGRMMRFVRFKKAEPLALAWTPAGDRLIVACDDGRVRIVDADMARVTHDLPAIDGWAYAVGVHPDGRFVAVGGTGGVLKRIAIP